MQAYKNIDEYISNFPLDVQKILQKMRVTIQAADPEAKEKISYGIPTFTLKGKNLVHFGAYPKHIGFYPGPSAIAAFKDDLKAYEGSKGTVRFPLEKPVPYDLVKKITKACAAAQQK